MDNNLCWIIHDNSTDLGANLLQWCQDLPQRLGALVKTHSGDASLLHCPLRYCQESVAGGPRASPTLFM